MTRPIDEPGTAPPRARWLGLCLALVVAEAAYRIAEAIGGPRVGPLRIACGTAAGCFILWLKPWAPWIGLWPIRTARLSPEHLIGLASRDLAHGHDAAARSSIAAALDAMMDSPTGWKLAHPWCHEISPRVPTHLQLYAAHMALFAALTAQALEDPGPQSVATMISVHCRLSRLRPPASFAECHTAVLGVTGLWQERRDELPYPHQEGGDFSKLDIMARLTLQQFASSAKLFQEILREGQLR